MILYAETKNNHRDVINISTIQQGNTGFEVFLDDDTLKVDMLAGYAIQLQLDGKYHIAFNQEKYNSYIAELKKEEAVKSGEELINKLTEKNVLDTASDEQAYIMRYLYEPWEKDTDYKEGDRRLYGDNLYKCKKNHTSQEQHTPDLIPAFWDIIGDDTSGTKDNPVIVPDMVSSMVYVKGKYYQEGNVLYLMNREGMEEGQEISLTFKPSQLVGHYFEVVSK